MQGMPGQSYCLGEDVCGDYKHYWNDLKFVRSRYHRVFETKKTDRGRKAVNHHRTPMDLCWWHPVDDTGNFGTGSCCIFLIGPEAFAESLLSKSLFGRERLYAQISS